MNYKPTLFFIVFIIGTMNVRCFHTHTKEYQLVLDISYFDDLDDGVELYMGTWSDASGVDYRDYQLSESVRVEYTTIGLEACGGEGFIRQRDYVSGDWEGLVTVGIKTTGSLSQTQAENEPFAPSDEFEDITIEFIEEDIHPCESDYASNTRIYYDEIVDFNTCADVERFFPEAGNGNPITQLETFSDEGFTLTIFREGTYLDTDITLDITIVYDTLSDALSNSQPRGGEFSFTLISRDGDYFSNEVISRSNDAYEYLLNTLGSFGEEYPCDDFDFNQSTRDSSSSNLDDSAASFLSSSLIIFIGALAAVL